MYLSRLILNPECRAVRRDLADCQAMHRSVMSAFPVVPDSIAPRAELGVLYRLEAPPLSRVLTLLVQSQVTPDWSHLDEGYLLHAGPYLDNPASKRIDEQYAGLETGMRLYFRLAANPTRRLCTDSGQDQDGTRGKRVELRGETRQTDWLRRKGEQHGFRLCAVRAFPGANNVRVMPEGDRMGFRVAGETKVRSRSTTRMTFASVLFEGELIVADAQAFRLALKNGIGPAKAYGFGLLSIAPWRG